MTRTSWRSLLFPCLLLWQTVEIPPPGDLSLSLISTICSFTLCSSSLSRSYFLQTSFSLILTQLTQWPVNPRAVRTPRPDKMMDNIIFLNAMFFFRLLFFLLFDRKSCYVVRLVYRCRKRYCLWNNIMSCSRVDWLLKGLIVSKSSFRLSMTGCVFFSVLLVNLLFLLLWILVWNSVFLSFVCKTPSSVSSFVSLKLENYRLFSRVFFVWWWKE